jgi:nicotinamide riboside kinase
MLAQALARHFEEPLSGEYVRQYWDEHNAHIGPEDLDAIARGQVAGEDLAASAARKLVVHDTDLLTCTLWDDLLFPGHCPAWARTVAEERARRCTLFLLCNTDLPFEPDPQRCYPDAEGREMCMRLWRNALVSRSLPFAEVRGCAEARMDCALQAVGKKGILHEG